MADEVQAAAAERERVETTVVADALAAGTVVEFGRLDQECRSKLARLVEEIGMALRLPSDPELQRQRLAEIYGEVVRRLEAVR